MYHRKPSFKLFLPAALLVIAVAACHKDKGTPASVTTTTSDSIGAPDYPIMVSGCKYAADLITFNFKKPGATSWSISNISWDFGDGAYSSNVNPKHAYALPGTYHVKVTVDGVAYTGKLTIASYLPGSTHTFDMAGARHWKGTASGIISEFPAMYGQPATIDTTLSVTVLSGGIIRLPLFSGYGVTFNLQTEDTITKVLKFTSCEITTAKVDYYYGTNRIIYTNYWSATTGHGYENFNMTGE